MYVKKNPAYGRHWISRRERIVATKQKKCYVSYVMCRVSRVACQLSHVTNANSRIVCKDQKINFFFRGTILDNFWAQINKSEITVLL